MNDGYGKIHETNVPTDVVDGVTDCEQTQENDSEPKSPLPADTVRDTTSDSNYKRAQEDKLGDRDNEEPHTVPIHHDKEVPREPTGYSIQELIQQVFNVPSPLNGSL